MASDLLGNKEVALMLGVTEAAVRKYKSSGRLPPPDRIVLGHPQWFRSTILAWQARRPGWRGKRPGRKRSA